MSGRNPGVVRGILECKIKERSPIPKKRPDTRFSPSTPFTPREDHHFGASGQFEYAKELSVTHYLGRFKYYWKLKLKPRAFINEHRALPCSAHSSGLFGFNSRD